MSGDTYVAYCWKSAADIAKLRIDASIRWSLKYECTQCPLCLGNYRIHLQQNRISEDFCLPQMENISVQKKNTEELKNERKGKFFFFYRRAKNLPLGMLSLLEKGWV